MHVGIYFLVYRVFFPANLKHLLGPIVMPSAILCSPWAIVGSISTRLNPVTHGKGGTVVQTGTEKLKFSINYALSFVLNFLRPNS